MLAPTSGTTRKPYEMSITITGTGEWYLNSNKKLRSKPLSFAVERPLINFPHPICPHCLHDGW